ncbi:MAG: efflux RND transporter permease subunit [Pseudomonadota bacterium]
MTRRVDVDQSSTERSGSGFPPAYFPIQRLANLSAIAAQWPAQTLGVLIWMTAIAAIGLIWLTADDALDSFLRSKTTDYVTYEQLRERFPASSLDAFVTVEADDLFSENTLLAMQDMTFEILMSDSVASVLSIFSLKEALQTGTAPASLIPDDIPQTKAELDDVRQRVLVHPLANGRLLSGNESGKQLALFIVTLKRSEVSERGLPVVIDELRSLLGPTASIPGLHVGLAGIPTMKAEVIEGTRRDIVTFSVFGLAVGAMVCAIFFRHWKLVLMANVPAVLAILWCLGLFGWSGTRIDPLMNAILPLVLVVTFNNAMHFLFAICRNLDIEADKIRAVDKAIREISPAIALTSITTSVALFSLAFSSSPLIQSFGLLSGTCVLVALVLVLALMPLLAMLFLRPGANYLHAKNPYHGVHELDTAASWIASYVGRYPGKVVAAGVITTSVFAAAYFQLEPRYRLSDMLPDHGDAAVVTQHIEEKLGGLYPLSVIVEWPDPLSRTSPEVTTAIADVHDGMSKLPGISKVNSLRDLQAWAESGGLSSQKASERLFETVPASVTSRFLNVGHRQALVSGYIADLEAKDILQVSSAVERHLKDMRARNPEFRFTLSGLSSVAATRSTQVISELSVSMLGAVAVVIVLIGVALGSVKMAGLSILPNLFALFATGTWLVLVNGGLNYATIVGLTVAFGLAVDDTVHVLNRYRLEVHKSGSVEAATQRTLKLIGTVLILTTLVLLAGLSVTQFSGVPPTREFGLVCIMTLFFALAADLFILPATILISERFKRHPFLHSQSSGTQSLQSSGASHTNPGA